MSTPNPLAPQGSLLEKQARSKSTLQVAALIVGLHVFGLGGFLILGCKKEEAKAPDVGATTAATNDVAAVSTPDTNAPVQAGTNAVATAPALGNGVPAGTGAGVGVGAVPGSGAGAGTAASGAGAGTAADASAAAAAAPTGSASEYKIQKGDIAFNLAKKHNVTLKALQEANPNVDLKKLKVGATIQIPAAGAPAEAKSSKAAGAAGAGTAADSAADATSGDVTVYHVKGGDSLGKIAKRHGTTVKAIRALNGLTNDGIRVGQKLKLPSKGAAAAAPATTSPTPDASPAPAASAPVASPVPTANGVPGAK